MRIDAVEVKLNIAPEHVAAALERLGIDREGSRREIYFAEDPQSDGNRLPLLDGGVVLRVRRAPDGKIDWTGEASALQAIPGFQRMVGATPSRRRKK